MNGAVPDAKPVIVESSEKKGRFIVKNVRRTRAREPKFKYVFNEYQFIFKFDSQSLGKAQR
jgi:hypothetical protein